MSTPGRSRHGKSICKQEQRHIPREGHALNEVSLKNYFFCSFSLRIGEFSKIFERISCMKTAEESKDREYFQTHFIRPGKCYTKTLEGHSN